MYIYIYIYIYIYKIILTRVNLFGDGIKSQRDIALPRLMMYIDFMIILNIYIN